MKKYEKIKVPFWLTDNLLVRDVDDSGYFSFSSGTFSGSSKCDWVRLRFYASEEDSEKDFDFLVYRHDLIVFVKKAKALLEAKSLTDIHKFHLALDEEDIIVGWRPELLQFAEAIEEFEKELQEVEDKKENDNNV